MFSKRAKPLSAKERALVEARLTTRRIAELEVDPVRGNFDAAHLGEINRRIFQDLPGFGFEDVTPGEYRPAVPPGKDWNKQRLLESVGTYSYVAYSPMDKNARERLYGALKGADPAALAKLGRAEFTQAMAGLYAELDYIHPFPDGNSRTLRTFTKQLAEAAGYTLDWARFNATDTDRDLLCIARDRAVTELALPNIRDVETARSVVYSMDQLEHNPGLPELLRDAIRPSRAVAFEQLPESEALQQHPELAKSYQALRVTAQALKKKLPGNEKAQRETLAMVKEKIIAKLDEGKTTSRTRERSRSR
jgi:cell filamentation protein